MVVDGATKNFNPNKSMSLKTEKRKLDSAMQSIKDHTSTQSPVERRLTEEELVRFYNLESGADIIERLCTELEKQEKLWGDACYKQGLQVEEQRQRAEKAEATVGAMALILKTPKEHDMLMLARLHELLEAETERDRLVEVEKENDISASIIASELQQGNLFKAAREAGFIKDRSRIALAAARKEIK